MTLIALASGCSALLALGGAVSAQAPAADVTPVLSWSFEGDLRDTSGHGLDGVARGAAAFASGREGQCLSLDGNGSCVAATAELPSLADTFTIECWVNPAPTQRPYADVYGNHANAFVGFALQQDGQQANCYYFTYGTGSAWVYSPTITLTPGVWQQVSVVRSSGRLRTYVDGVLVGSVVAEQPMAPSATPFMVGLGIEGQPRWFAGLVDEVRVWGVARRPESIAPPEAQLELFARNASVELTASSRWRIFRHDEQGSLRLRLDGEGVPDAVSGVRVEIVATRPSGEVLPAPAVVLTRENDFDASLTLAGEPGLHRVALRPVAMAADAERQMRESAFSYLVLSPEGTATPPAARRGPVTPLGGEWQIATDAANAGLGAAWFEGPVADARTTKVPWIIQGPFPGYHGLAWYWRRFEAPANPFPGGRTLLRFEAVDYKADVWVNGQPAGGHEGGETPFELDVTDLIHPGAENLVAVRVLNPTHEPIDGITLNTAPRRAKVIPYSAGASYDHGGIVGAVELAQVPALYIEDLCLRPDPGSGHVGIEVTVRNAGTSPVEATLGLAIAPASEGTTLDATASTAALAPGVHVLTGELWVDSPRAWELADPFLYRVTARLAVGEDADERADRCGFRDFRFERGAFRLNGRRLFLRGTHTVNATPVGQQVADDPALFQRDLVLLKAMGFNCIRFIWGGATRRQLDLCDEMGLLVYNEHAASNPMQDSPQMAERFDRSVRETILRDRNHPSVVIWGLLNETPEGPVFRHATEMLPLVRSLDESRMVMLNSGRWDGALGIGSISNPGATGWDTYLGAEGPDASVTHSTAIGGYWHAAGDAHVYPHVPHSAETIRFLRTLGKGTGPVFLTEYGIGSAVDLWRVTRQFERLGAADAEDAQYYAERLARFEADWQQWRLGDCFANEQAFFAASLRKMAGQRTLGLNAIRANPDLVGYSLTGMMDHVNCGEGLFTLFRELKPGTTDAVAEGLAPLRLCLFAEPHNVYRGKTVKLEAVLANEDALGPGSYPVRLQVVGPGMATVLDETVAVEVPEGEAPLALPFYSREVATDWPAGEYRFLATMLRGGAPTGGDTPFAVYDPAALPAVGHEVTLCGADEGLRQWLAEHGVRTRDFGAGPAAEPEVILVAAGLGTVEAWRDLAVRVARGGTAVFLTPAALAEGDQPMRWAPLAQKGTVSSIYGWLYLKDEWAKVHPIFDGLESGGLMDYGVYADLIPDAVFAGQEPPAEAVSGGIKASQDYASGLMVGVYGLGAGRFVLNSLRIRERLGSDPVADRLLANLLRWASPAEGAGLTALPDDFGTQLSRLGYE
jgi:hypothetical protein